MIFCRSLQASFTEEQAQEKEKTDSNNNDGIKSFAITKRKMSIRSVSVEEVEGSKDKK